MELYHLLPFILVYYTVNKIDTYESISNDPLYMLVTSMKIPTHLLYTLSALPLAGLLFKSDKFVYTEHTSIAISYYILAKSIMYLIGQRNQEPLYNIGICTICSIMLIYTGIIPSDKILLVYMFILTNVYITIGTRKTSSDLVFFDILIAHIAFYFSKRALLNAS
jgi:hypothetical protein